MDYPYRGRDEQFRAIEERWAAAFEPPLEGRAELWDYGMRVGLAIFEHGEKLWEQRDNLLSHLLEDGAVERIAQWYREEQRSLDEELGF